jgi:hypothetical protein
VNAAAREIGPGWLKTTVLAVASIGLGVVFAVLCGSAAGVGEMAEISAVFGAVLGLLCAPAFAWGVWRRPRLGIPVVALPTAGVAYLGGLVTPPDGAPFFAMMLSVATYVGASFVVGVWSLVHTPRIDPTRCSRCGYSLVGLQADVCPECGYAPPPVRRPR